MPDPSPAPASTLLSPLARDGDTWVWRPRAGFKMQLPAELRDAARCDETFAALVLHPALRPAFMDERWVESYSRVQKAQWVEFARRLLELASGGGVTMEGILGEHAGATA